MKTRIWLMILSGFLLAACGAQPVAQVDITPGDCALGPGEQITLSLTGVIPSDALIQWSTSGGVVLAQNQGLNAVFTAPPQAGDVQISVYISTNLTPSSPVSRICRVGEAATDPPPSAPTALEPTAPSLEPNALSVTISEVMANPCGNEDYKKWNEYVELYNYGSQPVDVGGWWLADNGPDNQADMLVSWSSRRPGIGLGNLVTDSTIIPPGGFAVVLSPIYAEGMPPYNMPYHFPDGTIILTVAEGDRLGDDTFGIIGDGAGRDPLVLYSGGQNSIQKIISSYGSPQVVGNYPQDIRDNRSDLIPLDLKDCTSAERTGPTAPDSEENWRQVQDGSPGEAPFQ
jgi:hypothetical protein